MTKSTMLNITAYRSKCLWVVLWLILYNANTQAQDLIANSQRKPHLIQSQQESIQTKEGLVLSEALRKLHQSRGIYFTYDEKTLSNKRVNSLAKTSGKIEVLLERMLKDTGLQFKKVDKEVYVITEEAAGKKESDRATDASHAELLQNTSGSEGKESGVKGVNTASMDNRLGEFVQKTISGTVTSSLDNQPLPGVSISIKGTTIGTVTDSEGKYALNVPDDATTLLFSFIGFTTEEVPINNRTVIDISLAPDIQSLSEVVVVGYGTQKKSALTSAVSIVKGAEIVKAPVVNLTNALAGRVAWASTFASRLYFFSEVVDHMPCCEVYPNAE